MLLLLRPTLMAKVRNMPGYRSSTAKMVGSSGYRGLADRPGRRRDQGGRAELDAPGPTSSDVVIEQGTEIEVYEIDGAIAVVYPKHGAAALTVRRVRDRKTWTSRH